MGTTTEDMHRGLTFKGPPHNPLNQNRCLVIVEEQNEDCDDDVISEEEDKRLMEGRNSRTNEDRSEVNSSRSSASNECWTSTYRKLRRASELIGASAVAIDNKIEMAMDLVKNHLMFAVREEMDQMRSQIRGLTERNKQLEEENVILRASTAQENFSKMLEFSPPSPKPQDQFLPGCPTPSVNEPNVQCRDMTERWLATLADRHITSHQSLPQNLSLNLTDTGHDRRRKGTTLFPVSPHFGGHHVLAASPTIGMAGFRFPASQTHLVQQFQPTHFVSPFDPQVSSDVSSYGGGGGNTTPRFIILNPEVGLEGYNGMTWTPTNDYNIIQLTNQNLQHQLKGEAFQK